MGGGQISSAAVEVTTGLGEPLREHDIPPLAGERLSMPQLGSSSRTAPRMSARSIMTLPGGA